MSDRPASVVVVLELGVGEALARDDDRAQRRDRRNTHPLGLRQGKAKVNEDTMFQGQLLKDLKEIVRR